MIMMLEQLEVGVDYTIEIPERDRFPVIVQHLIKVIELSYDSPMQF